MIYLPPVKLDRHILSNEAGPLAQFIKYGIVGVMATCVQTGIFYVLAATCLKCLTADDWAVKLLGLPSVAFTGDEAWYASRGMLASAATAIGFVVANVFCWLMNRWFVFKPGKFRWYVELGFGLMTTLAVVVEVVVSFLVNFFIRKFVIFKG